MCSSACPSSISVCSSEYRCSQGSWLKEWLPISCPAAAIARRSSRFLSSAASWPTMNTVTVRLRALRMSRTRGTTTSRYDGKRCHAGSPCVLRYDHLLSRSSDKLAKGFPGRAVDDVVNAEIPSVREAHGYGGGRQGPSGGDRLQGSGRHRAEAEDCRSPPSSFERSSRSAGA